MGALALSVDHIGSTSVPGLLAKDLIDLQVVVLTLPDTITAAAHALDAGLVAVRDGNFYAIDRHDRQHPVRILVDADPADRSTCTFTPLPPRSGGRCCCSATGSRSPRTPPGPPRDSNATSPLGLTATSTTTAATNAAGSTTPSTVPNTGPTRLAGKSKTQTHQDTDR